VSRIPLFAWAESIPSSENPLPKGGFDDDFDR
jgi:hypothetical protein